jgi:hypothetical protein
VESRGNAGGYPGGVTTFGSTLHYGLCRANEFFVVCCFFGFADEVSGPYYPQDAWAKAHAEYTVPSGDLADDFHVYGLLWTETSLVTYIDTPAQVVLNVSVANASFWQQGGWQGSSLDNPWAGRGADAPFDQVRMGVVRDRGFLLMMLAGARSSI